MERGRRVAQQHVIRAGKELGDALSALDRDDLLRQSIELHVQILAILVRGLMDADIRDEEATDHGHQRAAAMHNRHIRTM